MAMMCALQIQGCFEPLSSPTGGRLSPVWMFPKGFVVCQSNNKTLTQTEWRWVTSSLIASSFAALQWHHWATDFFHLFYRIRLSPLHLISCTDAHISAWSHAGVCVCVRDNVEVWLSVLVKDCQKVYLKAAVWSATFSQLPWESTFMITVCDTRKHCIGENLR